MKNNVYVRSNRSIQTISLTRMVLLLPMIIYGIYKNGIYLYMHHYCGVMGLFKPIIIIFGGALIGALVNIIYEYIFKHSKDSLLSILFSSFHIEYGLIIGCLMSININVYLYFIILFIGLFISKFVKNRVNIMALIFIIIYILQSKMFGGFSYINAYESSKVFSYEFMDYMIGRGVGGIATTHIILLIIALFGMYVTNNNKNHISLVSILTIILLFAFYSIYSNHPFIPLIFAYNYLFICSYVATDFVTSCYTVKGTILYGSIVGILLFGFYFLNPILAPYIAILIASVLNNLIDRKVNKS
ncbi:MAG TPA: RnfABCDGE type electron transport complex subunit D [Bacilli bacterium]|jgi:Na+-translocating ferredoxin:NAD+ oxidoreductase RnfD subunit|nr:RnfABCDGE type electron transport complex subunit D [Bacilli bacterium]